MLTRVEMLKINSEQALALWKLAEEVVDLREAIKEALEALDDCTCDEPEKGHEMVACNVALRLRAALPEEERHER